LDRGDKPITIGGLPKPAGTSGHDKNRQNVTSGLQRRLVFAFVCTERMALAGGGCQTRNAGGAGATMLALVFGLLGSLIQSVLAFVGAIRMALTGSSRQSVGAVGFGSAILALVVHT